MTNEEIISLVKTIPTKIPYPKKSPSQRVIDFYQPGLYNEICAHTSFLPETTRISERLFCIEHNIRER